ncbi:methionine--tRNA ligase [Mycoplasmopsis cynos]|uniref:methionine--tRNA ligase n=1 Tax=Mycoplasmopsis cynos TaxID=171284 RepID=UPI00296A3279|nr:methionine--tRNA ligase [Mycoplasmopsis cynos]MCU9933367.1 methionine--tRNA ligase [Mycoplasmopsis cynos]WQQ13496.1 methionine--tRNA ligase [Mycoplasmopsis cynos]WQQ13934.1 methionine--tRNA ligase [Mycoplasmopsis cynos]WQQ15003.1 methionine--tRNA ligase [Mycoplasmopsis cynos]WQQ17233.1 methionine--tRNA ligase [Mycoplasmopsis cynos]
MKKRFYITTPIYYASGNLHIGHLYTTTLAWVIANFKRLSGYEVKMLTGSDEHGLKIQQKAKEKNVSPQELVDELSKKFIKMWEDFDISYDIFQRTSYLDHKQKVQKIFSYFYKKGFIYKDKYQGLYSVSDEEFLTETQAIKKDGKLCHPVSFKELTTVYEESYFFDMKAFVPWLVQYIDYHPNWLMPVKTKNELLSNFINIGLENLSVTRINIDWGIRVLEDTKHTLYVWLDALCNYITALGYDVDDPNSPEFLKFWQDENVEKVHLVGKEITRFHMIYWPIFLKALNISLPTRIQSHGWILDQYGRKMSKSLNNVVDPYDLLQKYHPEMIKYYLATQINFGDDGIFDENRFVNVINSDLINNFGNLISRTLKMKYLSFGSMSLKYYKTEYLEDIELENNIDKHFKTYFNYFNEYQVDKALKEIISLSDSLNKYIDVVKPWTLKENLSRLEEILIRLLNGIYTIATCLQVVLPKKMEEVKNALGMNDLSFDLVLDFNKFNETTQKEQFMLFERINVKK